jgi:hypothetical protein
MNDATTPGTGAQMMVLLLVFLGGPIGAVSLSNHLAPDSELAPVLSGLLAATVLFGGMLLWLGLAVLSLLTRSGRTRVGAAEPPKGTSGFVWMAAICGSVSALVTAIRSEGSAGLSLITLMAAFVAYGYSLHRLARAGYLPFIEDVG